MVNNAFGIAVTTFVGQNFGAGKYDRMKKSVRIGLCMGLCTALTLTLIFYNFGTPLFRLFTSDENVVSIGMQMLYHVAPALSLIHICICIEDQIYVHEGVRILGLGGSMRYRPGINQYTEKEMKKRVKKLWFPLLYQMCIRDRN